MKTILQLFQQGLTNPLIQFIIVACCTLIITSSLLLFISDRGNIISYTKEQIQGWENPSFDEMNTFIQTDLTNYNSYIPTSYECKQFTIDLIQNAHKQGYRAGYVTLYNPYGDDHAIACFQTTDKGLYFVEPQNDYLFTQHELHDMLNTQQYTPGTITLDTIPQYCNEYLVSWYMII